MVGAWWILRAHISGGGGGGGGSSGTGGGRFGSDVALSLTAGVVGWWGLSECTVGGRL